MLSQTADHALRAILYLAQQSEAVPVPADRIAAALGAPANYLSKTLRFLARAGIVTGLRGPTGGFRLAVAADELPVARVVQAVDEPRTRNVCLLGDRTCEEAEPCDAHRCWTSLAQLAREPLERTTIADLLAGRCPDAVDRASSFLT